MSKPNKPIWFNNDKSVVENNDTYQTIKTNKVTEINIGEASPHKVMVCTPCHSDVSMHYCQAVLKFQQACWAKKIGCSFTLLKSSLVTQGRNLCVAEMLSHEDKYTHLLFIDSDIDFNAETIFKMLEFDKDIIGVPYPMKTLSWDKIWRRINFKEDAVKNADDLAKAGFTFPVKIGDQRWIDIGAKVYAYIDDYITHVGEYSYCGRFKDDLLQATRPVKSVDDTKKIK